MKLLPIIIIAIFTEALGGALLSRGMKQVGDVIATLDANNFQLLANYGLTFLADLNPHIGYGAQIVLLTITNFSFISGLLLQIGFFLLLLTLLSRADLSYVLPVTSFSYVITATLAVFMLKEHVSVNRWFGILLICSGVLLVSRGESKTTKTEETGFNVEEQL